MLPGAPGRDGTDSIRQTDRNNGNMASRLRSRRKDLLVSCITYGMALKGGTWSKGNLGRMDAPIPRYCPLVNLLSNRSH